MEPINAEIIPEGNPGQAVALRNNNMAMAAPAPLTVKEIVAQVALIQNVMREVMHEGEHYGKIPGCGDKVSLLQPGAQKLCMTFRLAPEYTIQEVDLAGGHKEYRVTCTLKSIGTGTFVGQGVGICSSMESKYRYRGGARKCPECGKETIIMGKKFKPSDPEPGWLCWTKKGGCGQTWPKGAAEIESQSMEKQPNENPADTFNTVLKMAKKRAFVDATITATAASDIFTQDVADPEAEEGQAEASKTAQAAPKAAPTSKQTQAPKAAPAPSQPAKTPQEALDDVAQKWKVYMLSEIKKFHVEQFAYAVLLEQKKIQPGKKMEDMVPLLCPRTQTDWAAFWATVQLRKQRAIDEGGMPQEVTEAFDQAYTELPPEQPELPPQEDPPAAQPAKAPSAPPHAARSVPAPTSQSPEWFLDFIVPVPRKGQKRDAYLKNPDTIGGLYEAAKNGSEEASSRLFGFVAHYEPKGWTKNDGTVMPPNETDKKFRVALDEFSDWREKNKATEEGAGKRVPAGSAPPPSDDDVPF